MRTVFDRTNPADIACQRMSQGRNLPTNTRDPAKLINNNELRAGYSNTRYTSATRIGNWFEQCVIESGCKEGACPAIAPFHKEGLPFQKPGEESLFFKKQGKYVTEYSQRYILNPEYVGPAAESKQSSASCMKAAKESNPEMDFNKLNASEGNAGETFEYWKIIKNKTADLHPDDDDDFYATSASNIGSSTQVRYHAIMEYASPRSCCFCQWPRDMADFVRIRDMAVLSVAAIWLFL
jgi:hypothetical protein